MSTTPNNLFALQANFQSSRTADTPNVQNMQQGYEEGMAFQQWAAEQAQVLGRLKVFHSMAKSINDQQ